MSWPPLVLTWAYAPTHCVHILHTHTWVHTHTRVLTHTHNMPVKYSFRE